jgi:hypothetical protein
MRRDAVTRNISDRRAATSAKTLRHAALETPANDGAMIHHARKYPLSSPLRFKFAVPSRILFYPTSYCSIDRLVMIL